VQSGITTSWLTRRRPLETCLAAAGEAAAKLRANRKRDYFRIVQVLGKKQAATAALEQKEKDFFEAAQKWKQDESTYLC